MYDFLGPPPKRKGGARPQRPANPYDYLGPPLTPEGFPRYEILQEDPAPDPVPPVPQESPVPYDVSATLPEPARRMTGLLNPELTRAVLSARPQIDGVLGRHAMGPSPESLAQPKAQTQGRPFDFSANAPTLRSRSAPSPTPAVGMPQQGEMQSSHYATAPRNRPAAPYQPKQHRLGDLSAAYEAGGDPGKVSTGKGDSGGISYGAYQFSSKKGTAAAFVASPEFGPWASEFTNLTPGTPEFSRRWQAAAGRDPEAFKNAQHAYWQRSEFDKSASKIERATGYDIKQASDAVQDASWSMIVQHHAAPRLIGEAIQKTDKELKRDDPNYESSLIDNMYDLRTDYVKYLRDHAKDKANAHHFNNIITIRFPRERADAQRMLRARSKQ